MIHCHVLNPDNNALQCPPECKGKFDSLVHSICDYAETKTWCQASLKTVQIQNPDTVVHLKHLHDPLQRRIWQSASLNLRWPWNKEHGAFNTGAHYWNYFLAWVYINDNMVHGDQLNEAIDACMFLVCLYFLVSLSFCSSTVSVLGRRCAARTSTPARHHGVQ